jgi:MFS family permease
MSTQNYLPSINPQGKVQTSPSTFPTSNIHPHMVGALSVAQMVSWGTCYYGFAVLLPELEKAFSASRTSVSFAFTLSLLAGGIAAFGAGRAMQSGKYRQLMCAGSLVAGIGFLSLALAQTLWQVGLAWIIIGISNAATLYSPAFALLTRVFPNDYRARITTLTLLGGLASTVFWPLQSFFVTELGWRSNCFIAAAFHWAICLPIHWWFIPKLDSKPSSSGQASVTPVVTKLTPTQRKTVLLVISYMVFESLVQSGIGAHLLQIMASRGLSIIEAVTIASCFGLIQTLARGVILKLGSKISAGNLARWVVLIAPASLLILLFAKQSIFLALLFALLYGIGNGLSTIVRGTAIADLLSPAMVPKLSGTIEFSRAIASASGPFLAAWIYSQQNYDVVLLVMIGLLGLSASAIRVAWRVEDI